MSRFKGADLPAMVKGAPRIKFPYLTSYAYLKTQTDEQNRSVVNDPRREVLLDSGAFTAFNAGRSIELNEYLDFLSKWGPEMFGYMALDKLQDPITTDQNLKIMLEGGFKPIPIHVYGDDARRMDWLFEQSEWVALGGFRRPHRGSAPVEYVKEKMSWACGRPVHWLGYTALSMVKGFKPFSCDCASWNAAMQYGVLAVYSGGGNWWTGTKSDLEKEPAKKRGFIHAQIEKMGVDHTGLYAQVDGDTLWKWRPQELVRQFLRVHNEDMVPYRSDNIIGQITARSWVRYIFDVRRTLGTRVFLACTPELRFEYMVNDALEWAAGAGLCSKLEVL